MRVGILSMQRINNYGSFLQAYATKILVKKLAEKEGIPCSVEYVDYHPGKVIHENKEKKGILRKIDKAAEAFKVGAPLKETVKFIKYKKDYASKYFPLLGIDEHMNYEPNVDLLLIGSDEVFNCVQENSNVGFSPELFGAGNNAKVVASFAASFGNTTVQKLRDNHLFDTVSGLMKEEFDFFSVRDKNSWLAVDELTGRDALILLDPVLLYGYRMEIEGYNTFYPDKYMIAYGYTGRFTDDECSAVRAYADKHGLKILNVGGIQKCCDEFVDKDPLHVLGLFKNAECIVTDTFHGSILSVINEKPFAAFTRTEGYGNSEKLDDLLMRLKLEGRKATPNMLEMILDTPVNYDSTNEVIDSYRKNAEAYLLNCFEKCGEAE